MINDTDARYWNPVNSPWLDGSRAERAIPCGHTPTLLEARGLTPAMVDARIATWIEAMRAAVRESRKRRNVAA